MTDTDCRGLCAELLAEWDSYGSGGDAWDRARAALAQPEPDKSLDDMTGTTCYAITCGEYSDYSVCAAGGDYVMQWQPIETAPQEQRVLVFVLPWWEDDLSNGKAILATQGRYDAWWDDNGDEIDSDWKLISWQPLPSPPGKLKPLEVLRQAPVAVSERLPEETDCWPDGHDKVGCCWLWSPDECLGRWEVQHKDWASDVDGDYTHWLPHHALPVPP